MRKNCKNSLLYTISFGLLPLHYWIVAALNVESVCALLQTSLSHLHRCFLVVDCFLEQANGFLHVSDLMIGLETRLYVHVAFNDHFKWITFVLGELLTSSLHCISAKCRFQSITIEMLLQLLTLARWAWSLFLASLVSWIRELKELLTPLKIFHMSLAHCLSRLSMAPRSFSLSSRSRWDLKMFSWVNLTHDSGMLILQCNIKSFARHSQDSIIWGESIYPYFMSNQYLCFGRLNDREKWLI